MVAADPKLFPPGSILYIPEIGDVLVADKGKDIRGSRLDIFTGHGEKALLEALKINRQTRVTVIYLAQK